MVQQKKRNVMVNPFFQITLIIISLLTMSIALYKNIDVFQTGDTEPRLWKEYNKKLKNTEAKKQIEVGLAIKQFQKFNVLKNQFSFIGTVWFLFNIDLIAQDDLKHFAFERGRIDEISEPRISVLDGKKMMRFDITVSLTTPLDYKAFPLDDHRFFIILFNRTLSVKKFLFTTQKKNFTISEDAVTHGWRAVKHDVQTGHVTTSLDTLDTRKTDRYDAVLFSIDYARNARRYVTSILIPLLFLFYLGLFSFSVSTKASLGLSTASITGLLGYRFVIERLSPYVDYLMLSDYLFFMFFVASCIMFFLNIVDQYATRLSLMQKKAIIFALHFLVTFVTTYFLIF